LSFSVAFAAPRPSERASVRVVSVFPAIISSASTFPTRATLAVGGASAACREGERTIAAREG